MKTTDILIFGGGASGLAAAVTAKRIAPNFHVTILEHGKRVGKKLLATGNGRCNLGNVHFPCKDAYSGTVVALLPEIDARTEDTKNFFRSMGLLCRQDAEGRLYPRSNQASTVLDALRLSCCSYGVDIICDCEIQSLKKSKDTFLIETSLGTFLAYTVICTPGGVAAPQTGSDGSLFSLLKVFGHSFTKMTPALVGMEAESKELKILKGVRIAAAVSACSSNGTQLFTERGEVQFNEHSLSGICVMNLSAKCNHQNPAYLSLNLLPEYTAEQISALLWELYAARTDWELEDFLTALFPKKAGFALLRYAGIHLPQDAPVHQLTPMDIEKLTRCCQNWRFTVTGRGDWKEAQVTCGGIPLCEIDTSLQSVYAKGLFFAGEILDIHGICGGYNLDWAWHSGQYAVNHTVKYLKERGGN